MSSGDIIAAFSFSFNALGFCSIDDITSNTWG